MSEQQKLDKILEGITDIKVNIAKQQVYQDQLRKEMDAANKHIDNYKADRNKMIGWLSVAGLACTAFFSWVFKN